MTHTSQNRLTLLNPSSAKREVIHEGCPEIQETIKWSFPNFEYKGILCGMAAFKQHCSFGFWKGSLIFDGKAEKSEDAMGQFGRITSVKDLPAKSGLLGYIKKARQLNDEGVKVPRKAVPRGVRRELNVPDYFTNAIRRTRRR